MAQFCVLYAYGSLGFLFSLEEGRVRVASMRFKVVIYRASCSETSWWLRKSKVNFVSLFLSLVLVLSISPLKNRFSCVCVCLWRNRAAPLHVKFCFCFVCVVSLDFSSQSSLIEFRELFAMCHTQLTNDEHIK